MGQIWLHRMHKIPGFVVVNDEQEAAAAIKKQLPFFLKPFFPKNAIPVTPGLSLRYVNSQMGIMAVGLEISRSNNFFDKLSESKEALLHNQLRGLLYFLDVLVDGNIVN